jgi:predicted acetyltransferase
VARQDLVMNDCDLRLRPLSVADEAVAVTAHAELAADGFAFLPDYPSDRPWPEYVRMLTGWRCGRDLPPDRVPGTFLLAHVGPDVVGRVSVRFQLTEFLTGHGGHIGYGVRPGFRRRRYASEILRQSLVVARAEGVDRVLVTCDQDNPGSAAVIQRNGGVETDPWTGADGAVNRRFWID